MTLELTIYGSVTIAQTLNPQWSAKLHAYSINTAMPAKLTHAELREAYARLDGLAKVMDSVIKIPGTEVRIGFDALLGLLPGIGDAVSAAIGSYIIWEAKRLGVSKLTLARMAGNTAIDTVLGAIPLIGDIFDVAFRANMKNVALLRAHLEKRGVGPSVIEVPYERIR